MGQVDGSVREQQEIEAPEEAASAGEHLVVPHLLSSSLPQDALRVCGQDTL